MGATAPRTGSPQGRNDPCACGSGRKFKHCCARTDDSVPAQGGIARSELRRGAAAERAGRMKEAITAYRVAALELPEASSRLGHIFAGLGRRAEAVAAFRAAADAAPDDPERAMDLVRALLIGGDETAAEAQLRGVLARDPGNGDAQWLRGRILTEWGRFDEACECYERALAAGPDKAGAFYDLVRSRRLTKADHPLIERMLATTRRVTLADGRVKVHLALAKAFDDLGDYRAAMQHVVKATQVRKSLAVFDRGPTVRHVDALIDRFTPQFLAARQPHGDPSRVPVMIIGMPRSGTTLVEQILSSHAAVAGAGELHVWSGCDPLLNSAVSEEGLTRSQAQTARACLNALRAVAPTAERVIDKNPFNFLSAGLIAATFPDRPLPLHRLHPPRAALRLPGRSGRPGLLLSPIRAPDGPLARNIAAGNIHRGRLRIPDRRSRRRRPRTGWRHRSSLGPGLSRAAGQQAHGENQQRLAGAPAHLSVRRGTLAAIRALAGPLARPCAAGVMPRPKPGPFALPSSAGVSPGDP